jgi:2-polyprenyl-3-methyl-5-hydroxy-6-metoxy-1,4-benzoquinol methylase
MNLVIWPVSRSFPWRLSEADITSISEAFDSDWGISFLTSDGYAERLSSLPLEEIDAHDEAYLEAQSGGSEEPYFEVIARPSLHGLITSQHRAWLIDATAAAIAVVRNERIGGRILDVGCHVGHVSSVLADKVDNLILGIDPMEAAIAAGLRHHSRNQRVELKKNAIPLNGIDRFGLIVSIDAVHGVPLADHLKSYGRLLEPGGIALIASAAMYGSEWTKAVRNASNAGLSFLDAFVVGGYGGASSTESNRFNCEVMIALHKGPGHKIPKDFDEVRKLSERWWPEFQSYANDPATPDECKTQAFFLAHAGA